MPITLGRKNHPGARPRQEDFFDSRQMGDTQLVVLADGMGGYEGGDIASQEVTRGFISFVEQRLAKSDSIPELLVDAAYYANAQLARAKQGNKSNMGTTLVAVLVQDNHAWWLSVGDSLLYLWRNGQLQKINADHSHYQDLRQRVMLGWISAQQARDDPQRDGLTSALMGQELKHVDVSRFGIDLKNGDTLLLASDGLETLGSAQIASTLQRVRNPQQIADTLVDQVINAHAPEQDNVSVFAINYSGTEVPAPAAKTRTVTPSKTSTWRGLILPISMLVGGIVFGFVMNTILSQFSEPMPSTPVSNDSDDGNKQSVTIPAPSEAIKQENSSCDSIIDNFNTFMCQKIQDRDVLNLQWICRDLEDDLRRKSLENACRKVNGQDLATAGTPTAGTPTAGTPTAGTPTAGTPTAGTPAATE